MGQISLTQITKSISKIFIPNFFVFLHIRYEYIERDFCSDALVMPQGWDLGVRGVPWGQKFLF